MSWCFQILVIHENMKFFFAPPSFKVLLFRALKLSRKSSASFRTMRESTSVNKSSDAAMFAIFPDPHYIAVGAVEVSF